MLMFTQSEVKNRLLKALPPTAFMVLSRKMERVELPLKEVLVEANQPTSFVCFIESGLGSVVAESSDGETVEVGHVGREGMTGYHVLLMTETSMHKTFMQAAGTGIKVPVQTLEAVCDEHPSVRNLLLRYVHSCEVQLAHSALANARYSMHERLARWLLMSHDRLVGYGRSRKYPNARSLGSLIGCYEESLLASFPSPGRGHFFATDIPAGGGPWEH